MIRTRNTKRVKSGLFAAGFLLAALVALVAIECSDDQKYTEVESECGTGIGYDAGTFSTQSLCNSKCVAMNYGKYAYCPKDGVCVCSDSGTGTIEIEEYAVTVESESDSGKAGDGNYRAGVTVSISAGKAPANRKFRKWTSLSDKVQFVNAGSPKTTFVMPSGAVTVTAHFDDALFTDDSGRSYFTVKIGNRTWMAENLNYDVGGTGSWCYGNVVSNCDKYGRLYNREMADSVCSYSPTPGWRLAAVEDWDSLLLEAGGASAAGKALKSVSGWNDGGNGDDNLGFAALPGGYCSAGTCYGDGAQGYWWGYSEAAGSKEYYRFEIDANNSVQNVKITGVLDRNISVRCVKED
jgi:uncharacterized protein (TIGR02145 family)